MVDDWFVACGNSQTIRVTFYPVCTTDYSNVLKFTFVLAESTALLCHTISLVH